MFQKSTCKILVAEDDYLISEEIIRSLKQKGFEIIAEAADGLEAVKMTKEIHPDVILMDIKMPGIDGLEAGRQIQSTCPTPIVIITAYDNQKLVDEASSAGVGAFLVKPPEADQIERAITIAIARHDDLIKLQKLNTKLQKALDEIKQLHGIIPICASCMKIRDDQGIWNKIDRYIQEHSEVKFSHGICPDCTTKLYPDIDMNDKEKSNLKG